MMYITDIWDEIVTWCHDGIEPITYGLLYNWYAATDAREICSAGWHVPTETEFQTLIDYLDPSSGGKLKETGFVYWNDPNTGATNEVGFYGRGAGYRTIDGIFEHMKEDFFCWASNEDEDPDYYMASLGYDSDANAWVGSDDKHIGFPIRLIKDSTSLSNGETGLYTGNDGNIYRTICIGTQEWLADNLAETKYSNGDTIPEVTDAGAWAALATGALCAYDNDWNYV